MALGLLVGFVLQPDFGRSQAYATFYPVVLAAAYLLGPKPAAVAAVLSAAVAYWCLVPPAFQWKWDTPVGAALAFFLCTSAVGVYLIDRLTRTAAQRRPKPADLARINAVIFADLAARNTPAARPSVAAAQARAAASHSLRRKSDRSFDAGRNEHDVLALEPAGPERSSTRKHGAPSAGRLDATIH